jgi:hypothetical protein
MARRPCPPLPSTAILPSVTVDSYNVEIENEDGFVGDQANKGVFWDLVDKWRKPSAKAGKDPLGKRSSKKIGRQGLAKILADGDPKGAAVVASAIDEFAHHLVTVVRRYLRLREWRKTECIVIGGGFRASRVGALAVARTELLLRESGVNLTLDLIRNNPDEAGLLGAVHLLPDWMLNGHEGMLAIDLGGTNFRVGVISFGKASADLAKARVIKTERWRHRDEKPTREQATRKLIRMLRKLERWAESHEIRLVPMIGVACPGIIEEDGAIKRGGQNLPGNWQSSRFNLPAVIRAGMPKIGKNETLVVMHNDAVVQGLSERPRMRDMKRWGVLTIGTGLGNARYTNRNPNGGK